MIDDRVQRNGGFAGLAAWRGNVFAPAFAALELGLVAYCLARVRRASAGGEIITLTATALEVTRMDAAQPTQRFHPYWVQMQLQPGRWHGWPSRLLLRSHGREVEIGAFLNEAENLPVLVSRLATMFAAQPVEYELFLVGVQGGVETRRWTSYAGPLERGDRICLSDGAFRVVEVQERGGSPKRLVCQPYDDDWPPYRLEPPSRL